MTNPRHRLVESSDFDAIAAITNHYIRTTAIHFGYEEVAANELRTLWRQHEDLFPWVVAELDDEVIGYAKAGTYRARTAYDWIVESGIYFRHDCGGKGYGVPLYQRLIDLLRAQGFHTVIGGATMPNDASVKLHERLGFEHWGTVREAGYKHDRWHDVAFWQLFLQEPGSPANTRRSPADAWREVSGEQSA